MARFDRETEFDSNSIFRELRDRWMKAGNGERRTTRKLAIELDTRHQLVTCYATGTDNRKPPMWVLMRMCDMLGLELRFNPEGVVITKGRSKQGNPAMRADDIVASWFQLS